MKYPIASAPLAAISLWLLSFGTLTALAQPPSDCVRKIGATLPLSGRLAYQGVAVLRGLQLGVEDINAGARLPCKMELVAEDNAGEARLAASSAAKLLLTNQVDALLSDFTPMTQAVKSLAARENKLLLYMATVPEIARENPLFFMDYWKADDTARLLVEYLSRQSLNEVSFLTQQSEGCLSFEKSVQEEARKRGVRIAHVEAYLPGQTDLRANLLKIKSRTPAAILTCTWADSMIVMKQMKELGMISIRTVQMTAPFVPASDTPEMRRLYEENTAVSSWYGFAEGSLEPEQRQFIERYRSRFGEDPLPDSLFAYDDAFVLGTGLSVRQACTDGKCIDPRVHAILSLNVKGLAGPLHFDRDGVAQREQFLMRVRDGKWEKLPD